MKIRNVFFVLLTLIIVNNAFAVSSGDRVEANGTVNVRQTAAGTALGQQTSGSLGVVIGGPTTATLSGTSYTWYDVNFDTGVDGWVADSGSAIGLTVVAPVAPTQVAPGNGSSPGLQISTLTPTISWNTALGANGYGVYVEDLGNSALVYNNDSVGNVTSVMLPSGTLVAGHNYVWNMRSSDSAGYTYCTTHYYFYTQAAAQPPSISSVTPNPITADPNDNAQTLTINGANFVNKPTVLVTWTKPSAGSATLSSSEVSFISSSQLTMTIQLDKLADNWTVKVTNPDGQSSSAVGFVVNAPTAPAPSISSVSPNPVTGSDSHQTITIYGANFVNLPTLTLTWTVPPLPPAGGYVVPSGEVTFVSSTELQMYIDTTTAADNWTVKVTNPDGQSSSAAAFVVNAPVAAAPSISSVIPNPITADANNNPQTLTINGANFVNKPTLVLTWTGQSGYTVPASEVTYVTSSQLTMSIHLGAAADNWTVKVINPDTQSSSAVGFQVSAPNGTTGCSFPDTYPYPTANIYDPNNPSDPSTIDPWNFYNRECTSYVAWKLNVAAGTTTSPYFFSNHMLGGHFGDAGGWATNAAAIGFVTNNIPAVGSIAQWNAGEPGGGTTGHVAYVEAVNSDGTVAVSEYNYHLNHNFDLRCSVTPPRFLHIHDASIQANPSAADIATQIQTFAQQYQIPADIIAAVALKESNWKQFDSSGNPLTGPTGDIGIMQINVTSPALPFDTQKVRTNWVYNMQVACQILTNKFKGYGVDTASPYDSTYDTYQSILENWYYPVAWYNGSGSDAYSYVTTVWGYLKSLPNPASTYFNSIPALGDPTTLSLFPTTIYTSVPYPPGSLNLATATPSQLVSHDMYTLLILAQNGQKIHQWNWATSTAIDITSLITGGGGGGSAPVISNPKLTGTTFTLATSTEIGFNYVLEYKNAFSDSSWISVQTNSGSGAQIGLTNFGAVGPSRVYRVRVQ